MNYLLPRHNGGTGVASRLEGDCLPKLEGNSQVTDWNRIPPRLMQELPVACYVPGTVLEEETARSRAHKTLALVEVLETSFSTA